MLPRPNRDEDHPDAYVGVNMKMRDTYLYFFRCFFYGSEELAPLKPALDLCQQGKLYWAYFFCGQRLAHVENAACVLSCQETTEAVDATTASRRRIENLRWKHVMPASKLRWNIVILQESTKSTMSEYHS